ncbi:hypothetical protein BK655_17345 [Pseudomonas brassicacearum]|nr:hypothetical protein BK655_17345 [Pseudomonas brassicacearum]ROM95119.1 hypothetical protein BK656_11895 [Pseudomonas brassicacearum]RON07878.1 hypothetical protein BK657_01700 [Pseudomonas brassicacearum]
MSTPHRRRSITVAGVIIRLRVAITHRGITNRRRAITRHRVTINKAHATTRHRERRTGLIRIGVAGTAITGAAGMTTEAVEADVIIGDAATAIVDVAIAMDATATANLWATKSGALSAAFFVPAINPMG